MKFRYEITPPSFDFKLSYQDKIVTIGSCFSENIGEKFALNGFQTTINPYGTLFNPISIANALLEIISQKKYTVADLQFADGQYFSYQHYSKYKHENAQTLIDKIQYSNESTLLQLASAKALFITLGTSWGFYLKNNRQLVANCHKQPNSLFEQKLIDSSETISVFSNLIPQLQQLNPSLKIIFTISPVRYFALGVFENSIAKANLFNAVYQLTNSLKNVFYFPAYELLIDDLRDYRFYKNDLLHPNQLAIDYIWEKIADSFTDNHTQKYMLYYTAITKLQQHKLISADKNAIAEHIQIIQEKIAAFEKEFNTKYIILSDIK